MQFVILDAFDSNWLEGSQADVQGDLDGLNSALADAIKDFRSEMKASRRCGYRSGLLGIDSLIALTIVGGIWTRDVGREWDVTDAVESGEKVFVFLILAGLKTDAALAEFLAGKNLSLKFIVIPEEQAFADADLAAGPDQALPIIGLGGELARQQNLDATVKGITRALTAAIEPRGKDAGVVEDQQIAGPQQVWEVAEQAVGVEAAGSWHVQHPGAIAVDGGFLGDEFVGKTKVEVGNQHGVRL
jgi:hypothetical protein